MIATPPLRVVVVAPWGERLGGAEEMLWQLLRHRDPARLEPAVAFLGDGPFVEEVGALGVATAVVPVGRLRSPGATLATVRRLARLLRGHRPDLVLAWSAKPQIYTAPAAMLARTGAPQLWWQHQIPDGHWVDRIATALPARAVGCSSAAGERAQARLRPRRPSFVVTPGIDPAPAAGADGLRERLAIPAGRAVVGIAGRLQPWKGQDRFLGAIAELRRRGHDVHALVVGGDAYGRSPEYVAGLERLVGELGLTGAVTMTGQVDDARPYLAAMDVAVNASVGEPFGIVLLEAMAAGRAVVAVAAGGPLEIIEPDVTGVLAPGGEPEELAAAIDGLLADPARRARIAAAGAAWVREHHGATAMAARITDALAAARG
jgi:glycosyltransferase involved in cell wall biosynthesis